mgnify:CR=1 FL=1
MCTAATPTFELLNRYVKNPIPFPNWIKPKQKKHLIELRYNRLIEDEDIKTLVQEKIDIECEKMRTTIKELRKENQSLKTDNAVLKRQLEGYEKRRI